MGQPKDEGGKTIHVLKPIPGSTQTVLTGASTTPFTKGGSVRCITTSLTARIAIGQPPLTAGATDMLLNQNWAEHFSIAPGDVVAVNGATVEVTPLQ